MHATKTLLTIIAAVILALNSACATRPGSNSLTQNRLETASSPRVSLAAAADEEPVVLQAADYTGVMALSQRSSAQQLGVLTFNMQHKRKSSHLDEMARRFQATLRDMPVFILCQEVMFDRSKPDGHDNSAALLAGRLGYHSRGTQRSSDSEGVAILSKYPFEFYASRELASQTSRFLLGFNRVSVMGEFQVPSVGRVRVVNVHLTNWGFEKRVRHNQLRETLEWMSQREATTPADITILGGDFNMAPDSDERLLITDREATGDLSFEDFNSAQPTRGSPGHPSVRVDYVFIASPRHDVRFLNERRLFVSALSPVSDEQVWLSDHVPVLHEYAVKATALAAARPTLTPHSAVLR